MVDVPKLYKHMNAKFADDFLRGDSVRVGTLSDFRREEDHLPGIGDRLDAAYERTLDFTADHNSSDIIRKLDEAKFLKVSGGSKFEIVFRDSTCVEQFPDLYVFCLSETADFDFGYDAVIEVGDLRLFGGIIFGRMQELGLATKRGQAGPVEYKPVKVDFLESETLQATPYLKDSRFSENKEWRIILEPVSRPIEAKIISLTWPEGLLRRVR